jgi:hypothetical protein
MPPSIRFLPLLLVAAAATAQAQAKLEVRPDRQNVVASRLIGEWVPDVALTTRLGGSALSGGSNSSDPRAGGGMIFRSDPSVLSQIPDDIAAQVLRITPPVQVYMAGVMTLGGIEHPFLLGNLGGNPSVLFFRDKRRENGEVLKNADGESFLLALTPAKEPSNDLLFLGGDFNNQPFSAFRRVGSPATHGSGQTPSAR